ncbi:hypothetical protein [Streptomyces hyaluromycini]|uniref:hypothetical protein n=1 Tax=Streptomyces hyaluromycini TaxID=1377993 RepID=UPI0011AE29BF|nr:hypothetical protein [Streptomyces hyaluromycini]
MTFALAVPAAVLAFPVAGPAHAPALVHHTQALRTVGSKVNIAPANSQEFRCPATTAGGAAWDSCTAIDVGRGETLSVQINLSSDVQSADFQILRGNLQPLIVKGVSAFDLQPTVIGKNYAKTDVRVPVFVKSHNAATPVTHPIVTGWFDVR